MAKRMSTDQISFYDKSLKKQIEGLRNGWQGNPCPFCIIRH